MTKDKKNSHKKEDAEMSQIEALKQVIAEAEKTITSTKQKLAQIQGSENLKKRPETRQDDENVVYGVFDGQIMVGEDGKQYPVPSNYASKSKLVESDMLKLNITPNGNFIYKQVGPVERKYLIGIVETDDKGNFTINADGKRYKTLLAAATYFKVEPGDEITLVIPRDKESVWCAIENVLRKADDISQGDMDSEIFERLAEVKKNEAENNRKRNAQNEQNKEEDQEEINEPEKEKAPSAIERLEKEMEEEREKLKSLNNDMPEEELAKLKEEASHPAVEA